MLEDSFPVSPLEAHLSASFGFHTPSTLTRSSVPASVNIRVHGLKASRVEMDSVSLWHPDIMKWEHKPLISLQIAPNEINGGGGISLGFSYV